MTTRGRSEAVSVSDGSWIEGGSEKRAYVSPWFVATMKHAAFDRQQETLAPSLVERVVSALRRYIPESVDR